MERDRVAQHCGLGAMALDEEDDGAAAVDQGQNLSQMDEADVEQCIL